MSRFPRFSEKHYLQRKVWNMGKVCYGQWCCCFKFLKGNRLHWLFHASFGDIRFLKWCDVINSISWFLTILKGFSEILPLIKLISFFLKLKRILTKIGISWVKTFVQSAKHTPTRLHQFDGNYGKIRYVRDP